MWYWVKDCFISKSTSGNEYMSLSLVDEQMVEFKCYLWDVLETILRWHVIAFVGGSVPAPNVKGFIGFKLSALESDLGALNASQVLLDTYPQWAALLPQVPSYERFHGVICTLLSPWMVKDDEGVDTISLSTRQRVTLRVLAELPQLYEEYKVAYGGRKQHHAYAGGLLQHTFEMLCMAFGLRKWFPWKVDLFVLTLSILYHDYGKVGEYVEGGEYTEQLVLWPHPVASSFKFREVYGDLMSEELLQRILHSILSHNGRKEWMTASLPATIEAFILSELDLMSAWGHTISNTASMDYVSGMERRVVTSVVPED